MTLPTGITELELLALVEGDGSLPAAREAEVRAIVAGDAALSRMVRGMRIDREALCALPRVAAPASLLHDVEAAMEREVLAGLVLGEPADSPIPISSVVVTRPGVLRKLWDDSGTGARRLAVAAALLLAAGAGVWGLLSVLNLERSRPQPTTLARAAEEASTPGLPDPPAAPTPDTLAARPDQPDELLPEAPTDIIVLAPADQAAPEAAPERARKLTAQQALDLARAGRLLIRVRAADADTTAQRVHELALRTGKQTRWRPAEAAQVPLITQALASSESPRRPVVAPAPAAPNTTASDDKPRETAAPPVPLPANTSELRRLYPEMRVLYTIEFGQNEADLGSLIGVLTTGKDQVAEFVELETALPTPPSLNPAAILWWGQGPSNWVKRASVPLVVESHK